MFGREKPGGNFAPQRGAYSKQPTNEWDTPVATAYSPNAYGAPAGVEQGYDDWRTDPEHRTGFALLGQRDLGVYVVKTVETAQSMTTAVHGFTGSVEYQSQSPTAKVLEAREQIKPRAERAIENCDFVRSPELENAVEGYYQDHAQLKAVIEQVVGGGLTDDDRDKLAKLATGNNTIDYMINRLVAQKGDTPQMRADLLADADTAVSQVFLKEYAVGATTLEDSDLAEIANLHGLIRGQALQEGLATVDEKGKCDWVDMHSTGARRKRLITEADIESDIEGRQYLRDGAIHQDMRPAGQLIFHNTPHLADSARNDVGGGNFKLASRGAQFEASGSFNAGSNVDVIEQHTNVIHWCEKYMPLNYKEPRSNGGERTPGTVAVPIGELVEQAPYSARDIKYGVLRAKDGADMSDVTVIDTVLFGENSGAFDTPGKDGSDRTFVADYRANNQLVAQNYELDFGKAMSGEGGNPSMILLTEDDVRYNGGMLTPFGSGEGYPGTVLLDYDTQYRIDKSLGPEAFRQAITDWHAKLSGQIKHLQHKSMNNPRYKGKYMTPLRSGMLEFKVEGAIGSGPAWDAKTKNTANLFG